MTKIIHIRIKIIRVMTHDMVSANVYGSCGYNSLLGLYAVVGVFTNNNCYFPN